jgi:glycerol-3-phosphate acyltransferase PlsY
VLAVVAAAFLLGSIPFAYVAVRIAFRDDVRAYASGNPGATNAARHWSPRWRPVAFLGIFVLDGGKGYAAAALLPAWLGVASAWAPVAAGLAAVLGHVFTPFLLLRGGKGVATTIGVLFALEPVAATIALAAFAAVLLLTRVVAAGSLALAVTLPAAVLVHGVAPPPVAALAGALAVLIVVRHRANIGRMLGRAS